MFEKFIPFHLGETELKEKIFSRVKYLNEFYSEEWGEECLLLTNPTNNTNDIITYLVNRMPELHDTLPLVNEFSTVQLLRMIFVTIELNITAKSLKDNFIKQFALKSSDMLFGLRAIIVWQIMERYAPELIPENIEQQIEILLNPLLKDLELKISAMQFVNSAIDDLSKVEKLRPYYDDCVCYVETHIEKYLEANVTEYANEFQGRMFSEILATSLSVMGDIFQNKDMSEAIEPKYLMNTILNAVKQNTSRRFGFKRGGSRKKKGFTWNDERKIAFYHSVENLPKIKLKSRTGNNPEVSFWDHALDKLIEAEFDSVTESQLKKLGDSKDIPQSLFKKAVRAWRKYLFNESWNEMIEQEKPLAFGYFHALYLLKYPVEATYSSLETYYYRGKKLSENQTKL